MNIEMQCQRGFMMKSMCGTFIKWIAIVSSVIVLSVIILLGSIWYISSDYKLYGVPVLNYHQVNDVNISPLTIPVEVFKEQMDYLHRNGYHTITLDELYDYIVHDAPLPDKPVVITFDDGYIDNYEHAMPILKSYNMKATLFMISDAVNTPRFVSIEQMKMMESNNFTIEGHTNHHHILTHVGSQNWEDEISGGKRSLEGLAGKKISYLAYPGGFNNGGIQAITKNSGYKMAFTVEPGTVKPGQNLYALPRIPIFENDTTYISFLMRLHCAPFVAVTWQWRDDLLRNGHITLAELVPLF